MSETYEQPEEEDVDAEIRERDLVIIRDAMRKLSVHFDTVHIFCSKCGGGCTEGSNLGSGNWFARFGQVSEWVEKERHRSRLEVEE